MIKVWGILIGLLVLGGLVLSFWGIPRPEGDIRKVIPSTHFSKEK